FVESTAAMGGVQFSTLYLAEKIDRAEWTPVVVSPAEGDLTKACRKANVATHVVEQPCWRSTSIPVGQKLRMPNPFAWLWNVFALILAAKKLRTFLNAADYDLVVTKGMTAHFVGGTAARQAGIPSVWHLQDFISERWFGIYRRIFALAASWLPTRIVVDGQAIAGQLPSRLRLQTLVVHNGVDTNEFRPGDGAEVRREFNIPLDHIVVGHLGRVTPWKGQHYLIEAFARIATANPNVSLLIVGAPVFDNDTYQRSLLDTAARYDLAGRIKFAGYRHDTARLLKAMDVFAFTSVEKDTSPLALLSAMSCGLPIVAFDIAGVRELLNGDDQ